MKIIKKVKKGFTLIELLVVIAIMASLGAVGYVAILNMSNAGDKQAAKENIKQIGTVLGQFKQQRGSYPCDATAKMVEKRAAKYGELTGDTANPYFRQLFAKKGAVKEATFYAKIGEGMIEGNEAIDNGECLTPGENAFAYVMRKPADAEPAKGKKKDAEAPTKSPITSGPLLFCCVGKFTEPVPGDQLTFDMEAFREYAIAYNVDGATIDLDDDFLIPDEGNDSVGRLDEEQITKIFPEGSNNGANYIILPPARN